MPSTEHFLITRRALGLLPEWQRTALGEEAGNMASEYCAYPDMYFDLKNGGHEKAMPYYFETDGVQFHYLPDTPITPFYRYYKVRDDKNGLELLERPENANWRHAKRGFTHYFSKSSEALRAGDAKGCCSFLGCLLHMLQDYGFGLHSLEGPYGTDCFVLDRLFPAAKKYDMLPSRLMTCPVDLDSVNLAAKPPALLGTSVEEAVFHLYARHVANTLAARRICHEVATARVYSLSGIDVEKLFRAMFQNIVALCADVIFTVVSLATGKFDADASRLDNVFLSDMEPVERPWGLSHYGFMTMTIDQALDNDKKNAPLQLDVRAGGQARRELFKKGIGMGAHADARLMYDIPRGVYKKFSCRVGLFPGCAVPGGGVSTELFNDGAAAFSETLSAETPSVKIEISRPEGILGLRLRNPLGMGAREHIVLAEPLLSKH